MKNLQFIVFEGRSIPYPIFSRIDKADLKVCSARVVSSIFICSDSEISLVFSGIVYNNSVDSKSKIRVPKGC